MKDHEHNHDVNVKKVDRLSSTQVRLTLEFPEDVVKDHEKHTVHRFAQNAKIPGFRPGKAPTNMIRDRYKEEIEKEVISHLIEAGLEAAIHKTQLVPVSRPKLELVHGVLGSGKPLEFKAEFEIQPEIELSHYKGVPLKKAELEASEEEVKNTIDHLRDRFAVLEPLTTSVGEKGQFAVVEYGFVVEGAPDKKEGPQTMNVELGAGRILEELDKALLEMKVNESREVKATFPKDYHEATLSGVVANFTLKILELKKKTLPEMNDAFASQLKAGNTIDSLNKEIRESIVKNKEEDLRRTQRQEIVDYLIEKNKFDVPNSMVENQAAQLLQWMDNDMKRRGTSIQSLKNEELVKVRQRAESMVRSSLILREVAVKEKIVLDESKLQAKIDGVAVQLGYDSSKARSFLEGKGALDRLKDEVLTDQVFDYLLSQVTWQSRESKSSSKR